ncbi:Plexin domain-containing protein 2 [Branchiostoma belcheri]|nr:Plexin domain-containing protein 2 [Branchiostoma belcheri]
MALEINLPVAWPSGDINRAFVTIEKPWCMHSATGEASVPVCPFLLMFTDTCSMWPTPNTLIPRNQVRSYQAWVLDSWIWVALEKPPTPTAGDQDAGRWRVKEHGAARSLTPRSADSRKKDRTNSGLVELDHGYYKSQYSPSYPTPSGSWEIVGGGDGRNVVNSGTLDSGKRTKAVRLSFAFPFYGHPLRNLSIATEGFLSTGSLLLSSLASTQYIAPLMANFAAGKDPPSVVRYRDNGIFTTPPGLDNSRYMKLESYAPPLYLRTFCELGKDPITVPTGVTPLFWFMETTTATRNQALKRDEFPLNRFNGHGGRMPISRANHTIAALSVPVDTVSQ